MARKIPQARAELAMQQVKMAQVYPDTHLGIDAVLLITGWSSPTLYRKSQKMEFPPRVAPGKWHGGAVLAHQAKSSALMLEDVCEK